MKNVARCFAFAAILVLGGQSESIAQNQPSKELLEKWSADNPQEKVFLQTDKNQYFGGETIWMKAWCALDGTLTFLSRLLYVDMVNARGDVVLKKMYKIDSLGGVNADFDIDSKLPSGKYAINAYTLWMLNYPEYIFRKSIFVYNADYINKHDQPNLKALSLQFFAEGGDMVAGVPNRVAFKATDGSGLPVNVKGSVTDNTGKRVADFSTEHDGLGSFTIENPDAAKTYTATIAGASGIMSTYSLPQVKKQGIVMHVENGNPGRLFVMVSRSEFGKAAYNTVRVVAQMNGHQVYNAVLNVEEGETTAPISKKNLPPGILQITMFDSAGMPLAERLVFVSNYDVVKPVVRLDSVNLNTRGRNKYSFRLDDIAPASLSVAVTNASVDGATGKEENILSSFLMTSDLKGYINEPGYYFAKKDSATLHHLDLLLMTQGWRRFEWKKLLANQPVSLKYPVESAMNLRGTVTKSDRKEPVKDGKVSFIIKGEDSTSVMAEGGLTDKGEFLVKDINFYKGAMIAYMGTNNKKDNFIVDVHLEPSYIDSLKKSRSVPLVNIDTTDISNRKSAWANYLQGNINSLQAANFNGFNYLGNVVVKARRASKEDSLNAAYAGGPFLMGKAIDPEAYKNYTTIWQMIQVAVPGVTVEGDFFNPNISFNRYANLNGLSINNGSGLTAEGNEETGGPVIETNGIAFFLNEVNVSKDVINSLSPGDIGLIKVLKSEAASLNATEGAIAIYTKKGVSVNTAKYDKSFTQINREGYAIERRYYAPDYERHPEMNRSETDKRFTLYWNGTIQPSKDGVYRFSFYNSDLPKSFKLIIQGMDKEGQLIHHEQIIR